MRRTYFVLLLFPSLLFAQDTISVDAVSAMHVCSDKSPASSGPCATPPRALSKVNPTYPEKARQSRHEGTVVLNVTVGKDGSTHDLHVIKGVDDAIDQAAVSAVSQWKFEPATYEGNPVAVELRIEVNFRLQTNASATPGPATSSDAEQIRNLYTNANKAYGRGDYHTAANLARRITSLSPQHASAWNLLGISLLALNQLEAAADALETQIKIDTGSSFAYNNLGRVYWRQHKYDEAAAQFRRQIVINPQDHYAHANLAMMLRDEHKCGGSHARIGQAPGHYTEQSRRAARPGRMRHRPLQPGQRPFRVGTGHQRFIRTRHMEQRSLQSGETQYRTGACREVV